MSTYVIGAVWVGPQDTNVFPALAGASFNDANSWHTFSVPGPTDDVFLDTSTSLDPRGDGIPSYITLGSYTYPTFLPPAKFVPAQDASINHLYTGSGYFDIDLDGQELEVAADLFVGISLKNAHIEVRGGGVLTVADNIYVQSGQGPLALPKSILDVHGPGTLLKATNPGTPTSSTVTVGAIGESDFIVRDGAAFTSEGRLYGGLTSQIIFRNGAIVHINDFIFVNDTLLIEGPTTQVTTTQQLNLINNDLSTPTLTEASVTIRDGASLFTGSAGSGTNSSGVLGHRTGTTGTVNVVENGEWTQNGLLSVGFQGNANLYVNSYGRVQSLDAAVGRIAGASGFVEVKTSGTWEVDRDLSVGGLPTAVGGTGEVKVESGGSIVIGDDMKIWNTGTVTLDGGSIIAQTIEAVPGSTFDVLSGELTVDNFIGSLTLSGGTLSPGQSPGTTSVSQNFVIDNANSTVLIELASNGNTPGSDFDKVSVQGNADLDGQLELVLISGYVPTLGDSFNVITANSITGSFTSVLQPLTMPNGLEFTVNYTSNLVQLVVDNGTLTGDLDGDGFVGIDDLNLVLGNWNQNIPPANPLADPSGDGFVGIDDLNEVLGNWNAGTPPPSSSVPEPASAALLLIGSATLLCRAR